MLSLEEVRKIRWYKQGGAGIPLAISSPFSVISTRMYRKSGYFFPNDFAFSFKSLSGFLFFHFFDRDLAEAEGRKILERASSNPEFFRLLEADFRRAGREVERLAASFLDEDFSMQSLLSGYGDFWEATQCFWENSLFVDLLDPCEEEIIRFAFGDRADSVSSGNREVLFSPDEMTFFQKERRDMLSIAERVSGGMSDAEKRGMIERHSKAYYWIRNDYEHAPSLDADHYGSDLEGLLSDRDVREKIRAALGKFEESFLEKERLERELGLSEEDMRRLRFIRFIAAYRDERKKYNQISNFVFVRTIERICDTYDIDIDELKFLTPDEVSALLRGDLGIVSELRKRKESGVMYFSYRDGPFDLVSGSTVKEYYDAIEGGRVRIIQNQVDFPKLEVGDILVTQMTRPEFVPIMERAAAVVTDEGGITCHAAIVARELGIPCVIGTQTATRALRDGDMVEVDADRGIVRKL